ncbi:MAG: phosphopantetheine-binding protein, partial [Isosphaeraceae bacterium]
ERLVSEFRSRGLMAERLPFRRAYHTPRFGEALGPLREFFDGLELQSPRIPIYSCRGAAAMPDSITEIRRLVVDQWVQPVLFRQTVEAMYADGARIFVEVGARGSLTGYVEDVLRGRPHFAVSANLPRRSGVTQLNHLVASLYAQGVSIRPDVLYARRRPVALDLSRDLAVRPPSVPRPPTTTSVQLSEGLLRRLLAKSKREDVATPDDSATRVVIRDDAPSVPAHPVDSRKESALLDHFETMRRYLETQNDVMAAYLAHGVEDVSSSHRDVANGFPSSGVEDESRSLEPALVPKESVNGAPEPSHPTSGSIQDPGAVLLSLVSRRTGYPLDLLDLDQDMEADLGIDSIKRVEILGELQDQGLLAEGNDVEALARARTLRDVIARLKPSTAIPARGPSWSGEIVTLDPGVSFVGRWRLAPDDPIAHHHTLGGRRLSAVEPSRLGLPVLPFTVMAEILAQAASVLSPGRVVVSLRNVRAHRWIAYPESGIATIEARATREAARPDEVTVHLRTTANGSARESILAVEGVVAFARSRPEPPVAPPFRVEKGSPCRLTAETLYREQWLFHGPALQAMIHVGDSSRSGIEGTLKVLPRRALLPESRWPDLHTDPIVLDAFTHLLGTWGIDKQAGEEGDVMFPLRVGEIALFGPDPAEGEEIDCRIGIDEVTRPLVKARADLVTKSGHVWVQIRDWEDWRFYWPSRYRDVFRSPDTVLVGEPIDLTSGLAGSLGVWLEPPADMAKPVWRDVLEWIQTTPEERAETRAEGLALRDHTARIWSTVAAKEAARRLWRTQGEGSVFPADLSLCSDVDGRLRVRPVDASSSRTLAVVAAEAADGAAVAIGSLVVDARLGVAIVLVPSFDPAELIHTLGDDERQWIDLSGGNSEERRDRLARLWCVKRAAGRALAPRDPLAWRSSSVVG